MPAGYKHGRTIQVGPHTWKNPDRGALDLQDLDGVDETSPAIVGLLAETTPNNPDGIYKTQPHIVEETQADDDDDTSWELTGVPYGNPIEDRDTYGTFDAQGAGAMPWGLRTKLFVLARSVDGDPISIAIYKDGVQETTPVVFSNTRWTQIEVGELIPDLFHFYTLRAWGGTSHLSSFTSMTRATFFNPADTNDEGDDVTDTEAVSSPVVEFIGLDHDDGTAGGITPYPSIIARVVPVTLEPSCEGDQLHFGLAEKGIGDTDGNYFFDYEPYANDNEIDMSLFKNDVPTAVLSILFHFRSFRTWAWQWPGFTSPDGRDPQTSETYSYSNGTGGVGVLADDVAAGEEFEYAITGVNFTGPAGPTGVFSDHRFSLGYFCQSVDDPFFNDYGSFPETLPFGSDFDLAWDDYESGGFVFNDFDHYTIRVFDEATLAELGGLLVDPATSPTTLNSLTMGLTPGVPYRFVLSAVYSDGSFGWDSVVVTFGGFRPQIYRRRVVMG